MNGCGCWLSRCDDENCTQIIEHELTDSQWINQNTMECNINLDANNNNIRRYLNVLINIQVKCQYTKYQWKNQFPYGADENGVNDYTVSQKAKIFIVHFKDVYVNKNCFNNIYGSFGGGLIQVFIRTQEINNINKNLEAFSDYDIKQ